MENILKISNSIPMVVMCIDTGEKIAQQMLYKILSGKFNTYSSKGEGLSEETKKMDKSYNAAIFKIDTIDKGTKDLRPYIGVVSKDGENGLQTTLKMDKCLPPDGTLIINKDGIPLEKIKQKIKHQTISIGIEDKKCDYLAKNIVVSQEKTCFDIVSRYSKAQFEINDTGISNVYSTLVAVASAQMMGIELDEIKKALSSKK